MHEIQLRRPWDRFSGLDWQLVVVDVPDVSLRTESSIGCRRSGELSTRLQFTHRFEWDRDDLFVHFGEWQGKLESVRVNETLFSPASAPLVVNLAKILLGFNQIEIITQCPSQGIGTSSYGQCCVEDSGSFEVKCLAGSSLNFRSGHHSTV